MNQQDSATVEIKGIPTPKEDNDTPIPFLWSTVTKWIYVSSGICLFLNILFIFGGVVSSFFLLTLQAHQIIYMIIWNIGFFTAFFYNIALIVLTSKDKLKPDTWIIVGVYEIIIFVNLLELIIPLIYDLVMVYNKTLLTYFFDFAFMFFTAFIALMNFIQCIAIWKLVFEREIVVEKIIVSQNKGYQKQISQSPENIRFQDCALQMSNTISKCAN